MTTCVDFYKKWEKNPNWCKKSTRTVQEIERYQNLLKELEEMGVLKERVIRALPRSAAQPLMEISDPEKRKEAISAVENALNLKTPTGGAIKNKITKPEVEKIVEKISPSEIKKENPAINLPPKSHTGTGSFAPAPHSIPVTDTPPMQPLSVTKAAELAATKSDSEFFDTTPAPTHPAPPVVSADPDKQKRAERGWYAEKYIESLHGDAKTTAIDLMRADPQAYPKAADLLFYAVRALSESKKKR